MVETHNGRGVLGWGIAFVIIGALFGEFGPAAVYSLLAGSSSAVTVEHFVHLLTYALLPLGGGLVAAGIVLRHLERVEARVQQFRESGSE